MSRRSVKTKIDTADSHFNKTPWAIVLTDIDNEIHKAENRLTELRRSKSIVNELINTGVPFPGKFSSQI
jgi:hypothetical protein